MIDAKRILDQLVSSGVAGGLAGGLAGGALAQTLSAKKVKKVAGSALQLGGLALVGGLAYKAWQNYQKQAGGDTAGATSTSPVENAFIPGTHDHAEANALSLLLARAIIAAAKADGRIDAGESQRILGQINALDIKPEEKAFLLAECNAPLDMQALVDAVDTPEHAAEVYAASVLTVDPPTPPEQFYLNALARELNLPPGLTNEIQTTVQDNRAAA